MRKGRKVREPIIRLQDTVQISPLTLLVCLMNESYLRNAVESRIRRDAGDYRVGSGPREMKAAPKN